MLRSSSRLACRSFAFGYSFKKRSSTRYPLRHSSSKASVMASSDSEVLNHACIPSTCCSRPKAVAHVLCHCRYCSTLAERVIQYLAASVSRYSTGALQGSRILQVHGAKRVVVSPTSPAGRLAPNCASYTTGLSHSPR